MNKTILVIDDENLLRRSVAVFLTHEKFNVLMAATGKEGLRLFETKDVDLVLLDMKLPDTNGLSLLREFKKREPQVYVIMVTAYGSIETAVNAVRHGASDYLTKPFELNELKLRINRLFETGSLRNRVDYITQKERAGSSLEGFIGESPAVRELKRNVTKLKEHSASTVLIEGATGTGKGLLSKIIHYTSTRAQKPFIEINCAAMPEALLEAELFGYEPGAFTDARITKKGLFEIAGEGTLFLDEIGDMSLGLQAKLLKVLEDKSIRRLGGIKNITCDTRIIAATNQDLRKKVRENLFRKDLFFRLNILSLHIPALKDRGEDVFLLADHFIRSFNRDFKKNIQSIDDGVRRVFREYSWPGNIRELRNIIERIFILETISVITPRHLNLTEVSADRPDQITSSLGGRNIQISLDMEEMDLKGLEKKVIEEALKYANYNQVKASRYLKISRDNLRYRIKKYRISKKR
jgi:two-component system, NtrC family, response regulator AtoC